MSTTTNLGLFKHDNPATNTDIFDIDKAINQNLDKIDLGIGKDRERLSLLEASNTIYNYKGKVDTLANLQSKTKTKGDVWYCEENSTYYSCNGTEWIPTNLNLKLGAIDEIKSKVIKCMQEIETPTPVSGTSINLSDSAEAKITELKISGNSKQNVEPTQENPSEVESCGDNIQLFDEELELGSFDNSTGAKSNNNNSVRSVNYIPVQSNTEYTISNDLNYHQYIYEYTSDYKYIKYTANTNNPFTFITSETTKYLMFRSTAGTMQNDLNVKYKLERGATATSYSSYGQGNITVVIDNNLDLSESNYKCQNYIIPVQEEMLEGDTFDWNNEEEIHTWGKYIITGDENWKKHTATNNNSFYWEASGTIANISLPTNNNEKGTIKNTHYNNYAVNNIVFNNIIGTGLAVGTVFYMTTGLDGISTISDFKTWLKSQYEAGTPVTMYYKLLEEKRIPFTEEQKEIAKQIINNAKTYDKVTHIYSTDKVSSNIEIKYKKDIETMFNTIITQ